MRRLGYEPPMEEVVIPPGHRVGGATSEAYKDYRAGLDSACADIILTTRLPDGRAAVISTKRGPGKLCAGMWWMQGGAVHSYRPYHEFLAERAAAECGAPADAIVVEALVGVYRTCASDFFGSTTNLCFVGYVDFDKIKSAYHDADHVDQRLLTLEDLSMLPKVERHWYFTRIAELALTTMPD